MAVYERDRARIVIRVVYDGPGRAGKTTNVEQLARIFGNKPGNELQVFPAATGRTIFFDWFSFDGGMIDGQQLQVQVVTVPGHKSLEPRRAHILRSADVVVLVCDSAVSGQDSAREMLDSLREYLGKSVPNVPLIVQANKQDLANAMLPHELGATLGLTYDIPVIGAQASAGIGVRETAIGAIRAAVRQMKRRTARQGLDAIVGQAGTVDELRVALQTIEAVNAGRGVGERRGPADEVRRVVPNALADEARVVYIRSNSVVTQLAGGVHGEANGRARATSAQVVPSAMSDPPDSERPRPAPVPVSAMFIEPRPANSPPEVAGIPAGAVPSAIHVPPPPVLARTLADERAPATDPTGVLALLEDAADDAVAFGEHEAAASPSPLARLFERDRQAELDAARPRLAAEGLAAPPGLAADDAAALDAPRDTTEPDHEHDAASPMTASPDLLADPRDPPAPMSGLMTASSDLAADARDPGMVSRPEFVADIAGAEPSTRSSDSSFDEPAPPTASSPDLAVDDATPSILTPMHTSSDAPAADRELVDADERDVTAATEPATEPDALGEPPRPGPELPPGHVWPVPAGRAVLERLAGQPLTPIIYPEEHALKSMSFQSSGYRLRTRPEWRFRERERERGREALIEHVRRAARLGPLQPAGIAVALAAGADEHALWHIVPDLPSLGAELRGAAEAERPRHLARLASAYAAALRLVAREDVALEFDPYAFAEQDGRWVYLDDRLGEPEQTPGLASALLAPCAELPGPLADAWLEAIEQVLPATLTREDVAALGLESELEAEATSLGREAEAQAVTRVRATLGRCT